MGVRVTLAVAPAWLLVLVLLGMRALAENTSWPHALDGIPVILTAFGACWVALSLLIRSQVSKLQQVLDTAKALGRALVEPLPGAPGAWVQERRYNRKAKKATEAIKNATIQLGDWRAMASGLEISGSTLLALGAVGSVAAWLLLP